MNIITYFKTLLLYGNRSLKKKPTVLGSKIHILGNAPGVEDGFASFYSKGDSICMVNYSYKTNLFFQLKPKYLVLIDPWYFKNNCPELEIMVEKIKSVTWNLNIIVRSNHYASKIIQRIKQLKLSNVQIKCIRVLKKYTREPSKLMFFLYRRNIAVSYFMNVTEAALYSAINLGYATIFLHGVRADFIKCSTINENNEVIFSDIHYYGKKMRNFTKEGLSKGEFFNHYLCMYKWSRGIFLLNKYAQSLQVNIFNCCEDSMIDSIKRITKNDKEKVNKKDNMMSCAELDE